jgi:hypothetical protein
MKNGNSKLVRTGVLYYKPFDSWGASGEWTVYIPENEIVESIALGSKHVIASMNDNIIRIFTLGGLQSAVLTRCGGPLVTMTAKDDLLFMVYYTGFMVNCPLAYEIYDLEYGVTLCEGQLPLTPKSDLVWIGFSESGVSATFRRKSGRPPNIFQIPTSYDSNGVLRGLMQKRSPSMWNVLLDTRTVLQNEQDWYWPVNLNDDLFYMIICKVNRITEYQNHISIIDCI